MRKNLFRQIITRNINGTKQRDETELGITKKY